jgi:hypothetical protein
MLTISFLLIMAIGIRIKFLRLEQRGALANFSSRVFDVTLSALSLTRLSFILLTIISGLLSAIVLFFLLRVLSPNEEIITHVRAAIIALFVGVVPLLLFGGTYVWKMVTAEYDDHSSLVARLREVVGDNKALDKRVHDLEGKSCPSCSSPPQSCQVSSIITNPNPQVNGAKTETIAAVHCNYKVSAPFCIGLLLDRPAFRASIVLSDEGTTMIDGGGVQGNETVSCIDSPSLPAEHMAEVHLFSYSDIPPRAVKFRVWPK